MSMPQLQNLGLSGYAWVGVDVGGFAGDATGELLTRWTEFGVFQPFCRNHSAWDTRRQEPWAFGEPYETHLRAMLQLRQRLLPYLYTLFEEAHRSGAPILRPLLFEHPSDPTTYTTDDEFMLGSAILVAPIARPGTEYRHAYLPEGSWMHYWSGERHAGPAHILAHAPLGQPAIYLRANTPVPLGPETTWLVHIDPNAGEASADLYEDAGEGYAYLDGHFSRTRVTCRATDAAVDFEFALAGESRHVATELDCRGVSRPTRITVDGSPTTDWEYADNRLVLRIGPNAERVHVALR
jgi:alpha-glucosidase